MDTICVTGATGYVGGRLVPLLLQRGLRVRCLARTPRKLDERDWRQHPAVEVRESDLSEVDVLTDQLRGCSVAYYLVHSMIASGPDYAERDRALARNFAEAAAGAGVKRIIYLGGLGDFEDSLSEHLRSRRETESTLASTGIPVTVLRAAMIIGAGSASYEILQYLVQRLPLMITPRWVETECQPVAIHDVLHWLAECLNVPETSGRVLEIGGPDVLSYRELMQTAAAEMGLRRRLILGVPLLTPRLSSAWISLVTPVPFEIARPLADGLSNRVIVRDDAVDRLMPHKPLSTREAIRTAIDATRSGKIETRWSVAGPVPGDPDWAGGKVFVDERTIDVEADQESVFAAVCRIGGGHGWYAGDALWRIRGLMDQAVGGPGLRRGRRDPEGIEFGETLDFWRVVGLDRSRSLSLRAEMKLPGEARLDFDIQPLGKPDHTRLTMTARFLPLGLLGIAYWYFVVPLHNIVFGGMLQGIRDTAEALLRSQTPADRSVIDTSPVESHYGRARLWLGISGVGTFVTLAGCGLALGAPDVINRILGNTLSGTLLGLLAFVAAYVLVHLPFDCFGGYILPKRHGRAHPAWREFLADLARGIAVHTLVVLACCVLLTIGGAFGGVTGTVIAGTAAVALLLVQRVRLASSMASLKVTPSDIEAVRDPDSLRILIGESGDEGFTGGVLGAYSPSGYLLPQKWRQVLGEERFRLALKRRSLAILTGSWQQGRDLSIVFTLLGLLISAWLVGSERLGTAGGTVGVSLWFTLWSFLGLLVLPSFSRRAAVAVDQRLRDNDVTAEEIDELTRALDRLQDNEPQRPGFVEAIFHPIPSVENRLRGPKIEGVLGAWDIARTAAFLSVGGIGLLGRAVHCNCGRPSLWVFLPSD